MRTFGLTHRVVLGSIVLCLLIVVITGFTIRHLSSLLNSAAHLKISDDVILEGSQLQDDLYLLLQTQEIFDQYISEQTWRHYLSFSQKVEDLIDRARELRSLRKQGKELADLEQTREEMATMIQNATYTIDPKFSVGALSPTTLAHIKNARSRLHQEIRSLLLKERENRHGLEGLLEEQIDAIRDAMIWVAVIVLLCGSVFAFYVHRAAMSPLRSLMNAMKSTEGGTFPGHVSPIGAPEMCELIQSFNQMNASFKKNQKRLDSMLSLAVTVAHEVRNPIAAIGMAIQTLEKSYPPEAPDREIFSEILKEVYRINSIISDLLVFARPKPLKITKISLKELLKELGIFVSPFLKEKEIEFEMAISPSAEILYGDENQIHRAILNLITNSVDAISQKGTIFLQTEAVDKNILKISIEDSGAGISEENLGKIFDPFFSTKSKGTGLGLSIVWDIIENHGGSIKALRGTKLGGARFEMEFPRESPKEVISQ
ncbi:MAG: ATP-binding protein [Candidatus Riflebacteria bacterium]|nr:ATP-binding protein [Candidatus Riflebacteria bacterium]